MFFGIPAELLSANEPIRFFGDGIQIARLAAEAAGVRSICETPHPLYIPSAASVAQCAWRNYRAGIGICTDDSIAPIYLRPSQAERERLGERE